MLKIILIAALLWVQTQPATYDVKVELDQVSTGTTTFAVDRSGNVSGNLRIDMPNIVQAKLTGTVKDGTWTFEYPFTMPEQNCTGTAAGTARVMPNLSSVSGTVTVSGACTPQPLTGTFTFTKK